MTGQLPSSDPQPAAKSKSGISDSSQGTEEKEAVYACYSAMCRAQTKKSESAEYSCYSCACRNDDGLVWSKVRKLASNSIISFELV